MRRELLDQSLISLQRVESLVMRDLDQRSAADVKNLCGKVFVCLGDAIENYLIINVSLLPF